MQFETTYLFREDFTSFYGRYKRWNSLAKALYTWASRNGHKLSKHWQGCVGSHDHYFCYLTVDSRETVKALTEAFNWPFYSFDEMYKVKIHNQELFLNDELRDWLSTIGGQLDLVNHSALLPTEESVIEYQLKYG